MIAAIAFVTLLGLLALFQLALAFGYVNHVLNVRQGRVSALHDGRTLADYLEA